MKEMGIINIDKRNETSTNANRRLRGTGFVPGNIYGKGMDSVPVSVKKDEFRRALTSFGRNSVFKLNVSDDKTYTVIVKEIQTTPILNEYSHVDFQQISLTEEIKTEVAIKIIGQELIESKKLLLMRQIDIIPVIGLPQSVPDTIEIDVSNLNMGDNITIKDLKLPEGITTELDQEQVVLSVNAPRVQEVDVEGEEAE